MAEQPNKLLVVEIAALGKEAGAALGTVGPLTFQTMDSVFPALTCAVQAAFRTEAMPCFHGMEGNGFFDRRLMRPFFWEQSATLVYGRRIWEKMRGAGLRVGMMFWQQSLGESVDLVLSPRPIHKHGGGMMMDCLSRPPDLYRRLKSSLGRPFPLHRFWGPLASLASSEWIVQATGDVMREPSLAPNLLLTYIPHLDYDFQRYGPDSPQAVRALTETGRLLERLWKTAEETGYDMVIFGDYAIVPVTRPPAFPNRALREAGLFQLHRVRRHAYPDFFHSRAFVVADHEIGFVHVRSERDADACAECLSSAPGIGAVYGREWQRCMGVDDPDGAELIVVPEPGGWIAYPWWTDPGEAPDYAGHVDIHNKPGYDPCELFFGFPPPRICTDASRIKGTHGRSDAGREVAWASSLDLGAPANVMSLGKAVQDRMELGLE